MNSHPFQAFLGVPATADAKSLLGLDMRESGRHGDVQQIETALRDRLARVYQHPLGRSPEAEYVRSELRKAAEALMQQAVQSTDSAVKPTAALPSWIAPRRPSQATPVFNLTAFDRLVLAALVASGGWNAQSRARLVSLASAHGVSVQGLMRVVQGLSQYASSGGARLGVSEITSGQSLSPYPQTGTSPLVGSAMLQRMTEALSTELKRDDPWPTVKLSVLFGVLTIILGSIGVKLMMSDRGATKTLGSNPAATSPPTEDGSSTVARPTAISISEEVRPRIATFPKRPTMLGNALPPESLAAARESTALAARLDEITRKLAVESEPSEAVFRHWEHDLDTMAISWPLLEPSTARQIDIALVEALRTGGDRPTVSDRLLTAFHPPQPVAVPLDLWRGVWRIGALARVAFAPPNAGLSPLVSQTARAMLESAISDQWPVPTTMDGAARAWLAAQVPTLVTRTPVDEHAEDFWELWLSANRALGTGDAHDEAMMTALHDVLATATDLSRPGPVVNILGRLLTIVMESKSAVPRERLLALFEDESIDSRDLWVLTSLIAFSDAVTWFPDRLVLPEDADQRQRWRTRDELASLWPQPSTETAIVPMISQGQPLQVDPVLAARWSATMDAAEHHAVMAMDDRAETLLRQLIRACRLNEAAEALAAGATSRAERLLVDLESDQAATSNATGQIARPDARVGQPMGPDAGWSQSYQEAGTSVQARIDLLRSLRTSAGGDLGPIDAELFVREVYRGSPAEVRSVAQEILQQFSRGPVVCLAMVDQLADAPATEATSRVITDFTSASLLMTRSNRWLEQARIALIAHVLDVLPEGKNETDDLSMTLAGSLAVRTGLWRKNESLGLDPQSPQNAARLLSQALLEHADQVVTSTAVPDDLDGLLRRRLTRFRLAEGPMQQFTAHQLAIIDLLAYITVAEQPIKRDAVIEVLRHSADRRTQCKHVLAQSVEIERTTAQLWRHRLGFGTEVKGLGTEDSGHSGQPSPQSPSPQPFAPSLQSPALSPQFLTQWQSRLEVLTPSDPVKYFELAEEIADAATDEGQRGMARNLFALSGAIDPKRLGHSACLAMAAMEEDVIAKRRLFALASLLNATSGAVPPTDPNQTVSSEAVSDSAAMALSDALGYYRRGQGPKALESLRKSGADELLTRIDKSLPSGAERIRDDCRHYKGQSRPSLSREHLVRLLRLELALLSSGERTWSGDLLLTSGRPLIEVDPDRLAETLNVNAGRPYFRTGRWVAQP